MMKMTSPSTSDLGMAPYVLLSSGSERKSFKTNTAPSGTIYGNVMTAPSAVVG